METMNSGEQTAEPVTTCFRHRRRETRVRCSRCDRFICPTCMREAPVGFRCGLCVRSENKTMRAARTVFGGRLTSKPYVTAVLIAVTIIAYLAEVAEPSLVDRFSNLGAGLIGPDGARYIDDGGDYPGYSREGIAYGQWYRLITSAFLHLPPTVGVLGIAHIALNMYWLWMLGRILEEQLGWWRFLAVYLLTAAGGSVLGFLHAPAQAAVGASGAVFGLAACYYVIAARLWQQPIDRRYLIITFIFWMVISAGFTSWQGHLGGLLTGLILGGILAYTPRKYRLPIHITAFAATGIALVAATALGAARILTA